MMLIDPFKDRVATLLGIPGQDLFDRGLSLSQVLARSPVARNSLDLVEAFATTIAQLDLDDRIDIPPVTMAGGIDELMRSIEQQLAEQAL